MSVDHTELLGVSRRLVKRHVAHLVTNTFDRAQLVEEEAESLAYALAEVAEQRLAELAEQQLAEAEVVYELPEAA